MKTTTKERTMKVPPELEKYLRSLTGRELFKLRSDSRENLAWQYELRNSNPLARTLARDNVRMLRTIRYLFS